VIKTVMRVTNELHEVLSWGFPVALLAIWILSGTALWHHYAGTSPKTPNPETGNIYTLNTNGSVAYRTLKDCLRLYGLMAVGFDGNLAIFVVDLRRRGWVAP